MSKKYVISDIHIQDEPLCQGLRGMSAGESESLIRENWLSLVKPEDTVYILGDMSIEGSVQRSIEFLEILPGRIVMVGGNHDTPELCLRLAKELDIPVVGSVDYLGYLLTHMPVHPGELEFFKGNIHGHIHKSGTIMIPEYGDWYYEGVTLEPGLKYFNANVEFNNYTPQDLDEIIKSLEK